MPLLVLALLGTQLVIVRAHRTDLRQLSERMSEQSTLSAALAGAATALDRVPLPRPPRHEFQPRGRFTPPARPTAASVAAPHADPGPQRIVRPPRVDPAPMFHPPRAS